MKHPIPDAALDDRLGFVGTAGSGKTYGAGTAVERLLKKRARVVITDPLGVWYGLRLLADGKTPSSHEVVIFGGPKGDLPLNEFAGTLIGETVAGMKESCIIDLSELGKKASERRFMLAFLTALYNHATREPLHIVFDEGDMWAPQRLLDKEGEAAKLLGMMETVVRRGRVRGFIPWLISQRPAVISKDVLSQVDGLVAFKLTSSQDRDAIGDWVEGQADKAVWKELWATLPTMERGTALVWLPARGLLKRLDFPEKDTFDSSRTPKRGERPARAAELKPLNIDALKSRLAKVEAETKANDPKALRAEITKLKTELQNTPKIFKSHSAPDKSLIDEAEKRGFEQAKRKLADATVEQIREARMTLLTALAEGLAPIMAMIKEEMSVVRGSREHLRGKAKAIEFMPSAQPPANPALHPAAPSVPLRTPSHAKPIAPIGNGADHTGELPKGERICLTAIAQHANGVTRQQLTVLTGYKRSSRDAYVARLVPRGAITMSGDRIHATQDGIAILGSHYEPLPTGDALREHVMTTLPEGERKVLHVLCARYPDAVIRDDIDVETGYQRSSRDAYLSRLSARELVEVIGRGAVKASDQLFG